MAAAARRRKVLAAADGCCLLLLLLDAHWPKQLDIIHSLIQYIGGVGCVSNIHMYVNNKNAQDISLNC